MGIGYYLSFLVKNGYFLAGRKWRHNFLLPYFSLFTFHFVIFILFTFYILHSTFHCYTSTLSTSILSTLYVLLFTEILSTFLHSTSVLFTSTLYLSLFTFHFGTIIYTAKGCRKSGTVNRRVRYFQNAPCTQNPHAQWW